MFKIEKSDQKVSSFEYFQKHVNLDYFLNGSIRAIDETRKTQTFNATLSLCDKYPLSLHEQVLPIVDLMAVNNSHFKKLKEFITLQLPSGFPIKIEIPLYRVITAKVTFGNIHAIDHPVDHVTTLRKLNSTRLPSEQSMTNQLNEPSLNGSSGSENSLLLNNEQFESGTNRAKSSNTEAAENSMCVVDEMAFKIPSSYRCTNFYLPPNLEANMFDQPSLAPSFGSGGAAAAASNRRAPTQLHYGQRLNEEDDILLQLAIQQSLAMEQGGVHNSDESTGNNNIFNREGATQSLDEYNSRRNLEIDEDLILQRVLAESLLYAGGVTAAVATTPSTALNPLSFMSNDSGIQQPPMGDMALSQILELSRREEEERKRRELEEEEELRKIIELSLIEK